jgi:hypothetical protein
VAAAWPGLAAIGAAPEPGAIAQSVALTLDPSEVNFGERDVGSTTEETAITARNDSGEDLPIGSVVLHGDPFAKTEDTCEHDTLRAHESCVVRVTFTPTSTGEFPGSVEFVTPSGSAAASLFGIGTSSTSTSETTSTSTTTTATSTSTTSPSPPPSTIPDDARLVECEQRAQDATVRFAPILDMTVGKTERFVVTASIADDVVVTTPDETSTTVVSVRLRCEIQGQLRGEDFEIDPDEFQQGSFLDRPAITWSWDVAPRRPGKSTLTLEVRSIAVIDGRRIEGAGGELYTSEIHVVAQPVDRWTRSKQWLEGVVDYPLVRGLGSLLLLGATIAAGWRWLLKRPWPWASAGGASEDETTVEGPDG